MQIEKLIVLGKSEATITMILDNLESCLLFPEIMVVNNMGLEILKPIDNTNFKITIINDVVKNFPAILGGFQVGTKVGIFNNFNLQNIEFVNIFHSNTSISSTCIFGIGCLINSYVSIAAHSNIGNFVSINRNSSIGHHTILHDFVTVNPGVNIAGNVVIGEKTQIGIGVNIVDGITIGKNCIIGAGSLVTKNISDNVLAYGVPAKIIKEL